MALSPAQAGAPTAEAQTFGAAVLEGPAIIIAAFVIGIAVTVMLDARRARDPRLATQERLAAVLAHSWRDMRGESELLEAQVFRKRRSGLSGAAADWLDRVSSGLGGRAGLRNLALLSAALGVGAASAMLALLGIGPLGALVGGVCAGAGGFVIVGGARRRAWAMAFQDQLIEAVELLGRTIRAGYAAPAAVRHVGLEMPPPVGPIFTRIADQEDLGVDPRKALREAARAVQLKDFSFLASALILQRETGGQLGESLANLHAVLRRRREARLKTQALTAQGRMSAKVVAAIPFVAYGGVYLLNPAQSMQMLKSDLGLTMLGVAGGLVGAGMMVVRWMVREKP
jgi:Flp pilus assembly protein TadB